MTPLTAASPYPSWNFPARPSARAADAEAAPPVDTWSWREGDSDQVVSHEVALSFLDFLQTHDAPTSEDDPLGLKLHTKYLVVDGAEFTAPLDLGRAEAGRRLEDELAWIREAATATCEAAPIRVQDDVVVIGSICLSRL